jgi:hypothetical protein
MENGERKRVPVALKPTMFERIEKYKETLHEDMEWRISRHALMIMAMSLGLNQMQQSYQCLKDLPA